MQHIKKLRNNFGKGMNLDYRKRDELVVDYRKNGER